MSKSTILRVAALFAMVGLLFATGCASTGDARQNAQASVYAANVALNTALRGAIVYAQLPRCPAKPACSDPTTLAKIAAAEQAAAQALDSAETTVRDPNATGDRVSAAISAATIAVGTLTAVTQALPTIQE
jgi:hypothetical protein